MTEFGKLSVGQTFGFISPSAGLNNYHQRCRKISQRCYVEIRATKSRMQVGSLHVTVYHVGSE
jgi:hypothetical protein